MLHTIELLTLTGEIAENEFRLALCMLTPLGSLLGLLRRLFKIRSHLEYLLLIEFKKGG
jgi:hypothetical protein